MNAPPTKAKVTALPGDGIGPEVMAATLQILGAAGGVAVISTSRMTPPPSAVQKASTITPSRSSPA